MTNGELELLKSMLSSKEEQIKQLEERLKENDALLDKAVSILDSSNEHLNKVISMAVDAIDNEQYRELTRKYLLAMKTTSKTDFLETDGVKNEQ